MARTPATSRRTAPTKVSKPFPWGVALGSLVLVLALGGLLFYAATNQGSGVRDIVRNPDAAIDGVEVAEAGSLSRDHVEGPVDYEELPPDGGPHSGTPQQCAVYDEPIAPENAVHSLEHGAVWLTYNDEVPAEQVRALADKVDGDPYGLMSPLPEQDAPIVLSAWGRQLTVQDADDPRIDEFLEAYASGPQTPERGAACVGTTETGPLGGVAPAPQQSPAASPAPSPAAEPEASPAG
jgi:hypothetical protein